MPAQQRFLPKNKSALLHYLLRAHDREVQLGAGSFLQAFIRDRLLAIAPLFQIAMNHERHCRALLAHATADKERLRKATRQCCSHFVQVFEMGVQRGRYAEAARAYYNLPVNGRAVRMPEGEREVQLRAQDILKGEERRVLAGGPPMQNPDAAELQALLDDYSAALSQSAIAAQNLRDARVATRSHIKEARAVLRKVWSYVELHYADHSASNVREYGRTWGIIYVQRGKLKHISGTVVDAATGEVLAGARIFISTGKGEKKSAADGSFKIGSTLLGTQLLQVELEGYAPFSLEIEMSDANVAGVVVALVRVPQQ